MCHDAAFAVGKLRGFGDKQFRHSGLLFGRSFERTKSMAPNSTARQRSGLRKNQNQDCRDPHCLSARHPARSGAIEGRWMDATSTLVAIAGAFLLAGFVKGVIGLGLPTVSIGLLGLLMTPAQAAAVLVVPSLVTNIWQAAVGGGLLALARRLCPLLAGICIGTAVGVAFLQRDDNGRATVWLGLALVVYAALGLVKVEFSVPRHAETWLGLLMGAATGAITVATGIFVMPGTPYIQSMEFD